MNPTPPPSVPVQRPAAAERERCPQGRATPGLGPRCMRRDNRVRGARRRSGRGVVVDVNDPSLRGNVNVDEPSWRCHADVDVDVDVVAALVT